MVDLRALFSRTPSTKSAKPPADRSADNPIAMYWDGAVLSPIKSGYFETSGEHSGFGAWAMPGASYREISNNDQGYAEAYISCEWVFRALNVRTQKIASVLAQGTIQDVNGKPIADHPFTAAMEMAYRMYRQDIWKAWPFSLGMYGEAYIQVVKAALGMLTMPRALRSLTPLAIEPYFVEGRIDHYDYQGDDGSYPLSPRDIVYDSYYNPLDEKRGLSLLAVALNSINIDRSIVIVTKSYLKNNARPGIIFTPKANSLTPGDLDLIKTVTSEKLKGPQNAGKPVIMPTPMDVTTVTPPSQADTQVLTDEKKRRICSVIGVPVALVDYTDMAFQLSEEQARNFYDLTVIPAAEEIARVVNSVLMPQFDRSGAKLVLPIDTILSQLQDPNTARAATATALAGGYLTLNEARKKHQEPEVEGGDIFFFQQGVIPIPLSQLSQAPALVAASQPQAQPTTGQMPPGMHPPGARPPLGSGQPPARPQLPPGNIAVHTATFDQTPVASVVKQATPSDELAAWRRKAIKSGAHKPFVAYTLPKHIEAFVRDELTGADTKAAVAAVFEDALGVLDTSTLKTFADTEDAFYNELLNIIGPAQADETSRAKFGGSLRSALRRYGLMAMRDGFNEVGYNPESLSADELAAFRDWQDQSSAYVSGFGSEIFKDGITKSEVDTRAQMWGNRSLSDIYYIGMALGAPNKKYRWALGNTEKHCATCKTNDGQVKTLKEWQAAGMPHSEHLDCGGFQCDCGLEEAD